ncbi:MAG: endopeptidase La [bacterium]
MPPTLRAPLIPLRGLVVFPRMIIPLLIGRAGSITALRKAEENDNLVFLSSQRDPQKEEPVSEDLFTVGTLAKITHVGVRPDGKAQALVEGVARYKILKILQVEPYYEVEIEEMPAPQEESVQSEALLRNLRNVYDIYMKYSPFMTAEILFTSVDQNDPDQFSDMIASQVNLKLEERQELLETVSPSQRLEKLLRLVSREIEILRLERKIHNEVRQQLTEPQRLAYLREQMRAIQKELGEKDVFQSEIEDLRTKINTAKLPKPVKERALKEVSRLEGMSSLSPEASVVRTYLDWLLELPWSKRSRATFDLKKVARVLDEDHYGLEEIKDRIVEYLAVKRLSKGRSSEGAILCFVGPPGVGKTSLGQSIARSLERRYVRAALGGVRDEAEIRGHRRTYVGALPGKIIQAIRRAGTHNPVFLLDEVDKIGVDFRGDPSAALLEALDPDQNHSFMDHYIELPFDLSEVLFITTANVDYTIPPPLLDRMEVIHLSSYTEEEKIKIAERHLISKVLRKSGLEGISLEMTQPALRSIVRYYTREAGVRNLEKAIAKICRKVARRFLEGGKNKVRVTPSNVGDFLGPPIFVSDPFTTQGGKVGIAMGLAWTEVGGTLTPVETVVMPGKGNLSLTGRLGEVMRESAQAALSYVRARGHVISDDFIEKHDLHIHVPEGAIPKDGPSAGVTILCSIYSALTHQPPRDGLAMTGEITLSGKILPVGGVKEKVLAAYREGLYEVYLPKANEKDLEKIPKEVRRKVKFNLVSECDEVLKAMFPEAKPAIESREVVSAPAH